MSSYQLSANCNAQSVLWPDVALLVASAVKVAAWALAIASIIAAVAFLPVELFVGLSMVGAYAFVFYPRKRVRSC